MQQRKPLNFFIDLKLKLANFYHTKQISKWLDFVMQFYNTPWKYKQIAGNQ